MDLSSPGVVAALMAGIFGLLGYFVSNKLEVSRSLRLREVEFRLGRYQEFLQALGEVSINKTYETQLRFVDSANVVLLIGGSDLLHAINDLVQNYNKKGDNQRQILSRIMHAMRRDLSTPESNNLGDFEFPIISSDVKPPVNAPQHDKAK